MLWEIRTSATGEICPHWSTSSSPPAILAAVPAFAFLAAQRETEKVASAGVKQGSYVMISEELKAKVAKYTAENGVSSLLRHFKD